MAVPEVYGVGPTLRRSGKSELWIVGKNLSNLRAGDGVIIVANGERWKIHKASDPIPTSDGNEKIHVRVKWAGIVRSAAPAADDDAPGGSDDDLAGLTVTVTNATDETVTVDETVAGDAVIDGPEIFEDP